MVAISSNVVDFLPRRLVPSPVGIFAFPLLLCQEGAQTANEGTVDLGCLDVCGDCKRFVLQGKFFWSLSILRA